MVVLFPKYKKRDKRLRTPKEAEIQFLGLLSFKDLVEQQIQSDLITKKEGYCTFRQKRFLKDTFDGYSHGFILHKASHKKEHRLDYNCYKENHSTNPNQVIYMLDIAYPRV